MEGYRPRSFDCKAGAHFHHGHVSGGPPIIPDSQFSQVRFGVSAIILPWAFPTSARVKRRFAYAPTAAASLLCPNCAHGMQFSHFWLFWHNLFSVSYGGGMGA